MMVANSLLTSTVGGLSSSIERSIFKLSYPGYYFPKICGSSSLGVVQVDNGSSGFETSDDHGPGIYGASFVS